MAKNMRKPFKLRSQGAPFKEVGAKKKAIKKAAKKAGLKVTSKAALASTGVGLLGSAVWEAGEIGYNAIKAGSLKKGYEKWKKDWKDIGGLFTK